MGLEKKINEDDRSDLEPKYFIPGIGVANYIIETLGQHYFDGGASMEAKDKAIRNGAILGLYNICLYYGLYAATNS